MRRILKYSLPPIGEVGLGMHGDPRHLSVGWQDGRLVLWAEVNTDEAARVHVFLIAMTGDPVPDGEYVGTAQLANTGQPYIVHVYRRPA